MTKLQRARLQPAHSVVTIILSLVLSTAFPWRVDWAALQLRMNAAYAIDLGGAGVSAGTRQEEPPQAIFGPALALQAYSYSTRFIVGQPFEVTLRWRSLAALPNPVLSTVRLLIGPQRLRAEQSEPIFPQQMASAGAIFTQTLRLNFDDMDQLWYAAPPLVVELEMTDLVTHRRLSLRQGRSLFGTPSRLARLAGDELQASECSIREIIHTTEPLSLTLPLSGTFLQGFWYAHHGIDIGSQVGRPVVAMQSGRVVMAGWNSQGYGLLVKLQHDDIALGPPQAPSSSSLQSIVLPLNATVDASTNMSAALESATSITATPIITMSLVPTMGMTSLYGHLSRVLVREGQWVQAGQTIGTVGLTGRTTGPHLHVELRIGGVPRNPLCYLPPMNMPPVLQTL